MDDFNILDKPTTLQLLQEKCEEIGFTMPSDLYIGTLLKTLISSKPNSRILELGTGIGLSLCWMIDGLDQNSKLITIDNDPKLIAIANDFFGNDNRVEILCKDGNQWIQDYKEDPFDIIFADAWPGKYSEIDTVFENLKVGGLYIIDDMNPQPNWPDGHQENVDNLIEYLEQREYLSITKLNWSTGVIIATKKH